METGMASFLPVGEKLRLHSILRCSVRHRYPKHLTKNEIKTAHRNCELLAYIPSKTPTVSAEKSPKNRSVLTVSSVLWQHSRSIKWSNWPNYSHSNAMEVFGQIAETVVNPTTHEPDRGNNLQRKTIGDIEMQPCNWQPTRLEFLSSEKTSKQEAQRQPVSGYSHRKPSQLAYFYRPLFCSLAYVQILPWGAGKCTSPSNKIWKNRPIESNDDWALCGKKLKNPTIIVTIRRWFRLGFLKLSLVTSFSKERMPDSNHLF